MGGYGRGGTSKTKREQKISLLSIFAFGLQELKFFKKSYLLPIINGTSVLIT
jgi:hypothetical protein